MTPTRAQDDPSGARSPIHRPHALHEGEAQ